MFKYVLILCLCLYLIYTIICLFLILAVAQIVPCYARLEFIELVRKSLVFRVLGARYKIHVKNRHSKTRMYDKGWEQLIKLNHLRVRDMLVCTMTRRNPKISVVIMEFGNNAKDSDEDSTDSHSDEDLESE